MQQLGNCFGSYFVLFPEKVATDHGYTVWLPG